MVWTANRDRFWDHSVRFDLKIVTVSYLRNRTFLKILMNNIGHRFTFTIVNTQHTQHVSAVPNPIIFLTVG